MEDEGYSDFLCELFDAGILDQPAEGITRQVLDKGKEALSEKQQHVFQKYVLDVYVTKECKRCGLEPPWCEMFEAYDNGGYCSWCAKMMSNDD